MTEQLSTTQSARRVGSLLDLMTQHGAAPVIYPFAKETLVARTSTRVVKVDEFASRILDSKNTTRTLLDFTQNISGWVRLTVDGKKGDVVTTPPC